MNDNPRSDNSHPAAWFEPLYAQANRNPDHIPWANLQPHPALVQCLSQHCPTAHTAIVIGCGLGDDAQALVDAGYTVTAFDIAASAIAWCQQRFPNSPVHYTTADLLALPSHWLGAFDLVWESRTIQSLPLSVRSQAIAAVASLVAPNGQLRLVTHWRPDNTVPTGPPWAVSDDELEHFTYAGLYERDRQLVQHAEKTLILAQLTFDRPAGS